MDPNLENPENNVDLARALETLASPVRIGLLHRLSRPAFMPELVREFKITRQALKKHVDALEAVGLVHGSRSRRGALPATEYRANPTGLFTFKENVRGIAVSSTPVRPPAPHTRAGRADTRSIPPRTGSGLLLVHGDAPGRWIGLGDKEEHVAGRDENTDIPLTYDAFASKRHALMRKSSTQWTITDLGSTNGTRVNFRAIPPREATVIHPGDLVTIGRSHLLFRDGS